MNEERQRERGERGWKKERERERERERESRGKRREQLVANGEN